MNPVLAAENVARCVADLRRRHDGHLVDRLADEIQWLLLSVRPSAADLYWAGFDPETIDRFVDEHRDHDRQLLGRRESEWVKLRER